MAIIFLSSGTFCVMKGTLAGKFLIKIFTKVNKLFNLILLPFVDHKNENIIKINLKIKGTLFNIIKSNRAHTSTGKIQYPNKQIVCIRDLKCYKTNYNLPPISFVLIVMTSEPIHIITNTVVNTIPEFLFEERDNINPNKMHIINGPHKSPKKFILCVENYIKIVYFKFNYIKTLILDKFYLHCFNSFIFSSVK